MTPSLLFLKIALEDPRSRIHIQSIHTWTNAAVYLGLPFSEPGTIVVNAGNDTLRSTVHCVVAPPTRSEIADKTEKIPFHSRECKDLVPSKLSLAMKWSGNETRSWSVVVIIINTELAASANGRAKVACPGACIHYLLFTTMAGYLSALRTIHHRSLHGQCRNLATLASVRVTGVLALTGVLQLNYWFFDRMFVQTRHFGFP